MVIKLKTKEGLEFSFGTVAEFMEFKKKMDEEEVSKELTSEPIEDTSDDEIEVPGTEPKLEAGDKDRVVSAEDGTETPYHHINIGSVVEVVSNQSRGGVEVVEDGVHQYLLPGHFEKVEPLGKDANGEDLYAGDFVTGINADVYYFTNSTVVMEVMGRGSSITDEESDIRVRIVGETSTYRVDSSKFVKLSDDLDEANDKFDDINGEGERKLLPVGTKIRMLRPSNCGDLLTGDVGTITDIDERCPMGLVYSVRVRSGEDGYGWAKREDVEVVEDEIEVPESEIEVEVGDKVRIVSSEDGTDTPYHYHDVGSVGKVVGKKQFGGIVVEADGRSQCLLPHHYVKLEPLGKDVNGEDLYEGDYVTGSKENEYAYTDDTDDTEVMEVLGYGESPLCEEANIQVKIDGDWTGYNVDSSKFIKLSDNLDEAMEKFNDNKVV